MILMCFQRNKMKNKNATSSEQFNEKFGEIHLIVMWYLIDSYEKTNWKWCLYITQKPVVT